LVAAITLGAIVLWSAARGRSGESANVQPTVASAAGVPEKLAYPVGPGTSYDVDWRVSSTVAVRGLPPQSTEIALRGVADVADLGADGARRLVGVRLTSLASATVSALGHALYPDVHAAEADLLRKPVVLALGADGAVEDVYLDPAASPLAKNALMALALHYGVTLPAKKAGAGAAYVATEPSDFGPVPWSYTRTVDRLVRSMDDGQNKGKGSLRFDGPLPIEIESELSVAEGPREAVEDPARSPVGVGSSAFHATRRPAAPAEPWAAPDVTKLERHAPDARPSLLDDRAANIAAANGMTIEDIQFMVGAYGNGQRPRQGDLIRAAGYMRANPESCDKLVETFPASPPRGRELIVDLLSSSGDAKAQAAMRTVLASPSARGDALLYPTMLQRFSFVDHPNAESVAFVNEEWERAKKTNDPSLREASAYTLGSLAYHASVSADARTATTILERLLRALAATKDADEHRGLVAALGNAGLDGALDAILARAASKDVPLRAQAAVALRKYDRPAVRARLVELACDEDLQVAQGALRSLDTQTVGLVELSALAERAEKGTMNTSVDPALVTFVASNAKGREAPARRVLLAVLARVGDRQDLKRQLDAAFGTIGEPPT